jgi:hypothetical protein
MPTPARRLARAWTEKPTAITLPVGMVLLGLYAIIRGEHVSRAFTNLGGGTIIRCVGIVMLIGGLLVVASIYSNDLSYEALGLMFSAAGAGLFGLGVLLGLGEQGVMAGGGFILIAVGLARRAQVLHRGMRRTRE